MKLWEKGKLFGLLNIIDIIVILLVVAAVVGVGAKTSVLRKMTAKSTVSLVRTQVFIDDILPESAAVPQVGDIVRELSSGEELGVVKDVKVEDHVEKASDAQGNWHMNPVPGRKSVILTLEGDLAAYNNQFRVGTMNVKVGSKITIDGDFYQFDGAIIEVEVIK
jgi:hypothetical protein